MRDQPSGPVLLALARDLLLKDLLPLLPAEVRVKTRLVATCMAIAAREAAAGAGPVDKIIAAVQEFYGSPAIAVSDLGGEAGAKLLRRFALDLRNGAFETSESQERAARAILWRMTIAKLREGNPGFLAANGFAGS